MDSLQAGQTLQLTISDVAFGGEGVARHGEFVIFVPFVLVGEEVEVELTEIKKRFGRARLLKVLKASPHRAQPLCRYFGECGGCQYQHIDYPTQLQIKQKQIQDLLGRIGQIQSVLIDPVRPCPRPYHYRNRIMIRSQWDKFKQGLNIGFIRHDNRLVVDIDECVISEPILNEELRKVRKNPPPKGGIKVVLRVAPEGWEVPRDSFFQNNDYMLDEMIAVTRGMLLEGGARFLIDAYCGVGFFSVQLADSVERFVGVEVDLRAVQAARHNAIRRKRENGEYLLGRTEELLPELLKRFDSASTSIILDPPRTGCPRESLEQLLAVQPRQILYVSCHPATLARDLHILSATGIYELQRIVPLDMFPQTQHVECIADLRLKRQAGG